MNFIQRSEIYLNKLNSCFSPETYKQIEYLSQTLLSAWRDRKRVFICGNGGSAANALHIANDLHYGVGCSTDGTNVPGIRVEALPSNSAILTCLGNDIGYENIFSNQLTVNANSGDLLIALSGSGNSPNIVKAIKTANELRMHSFAILAFDGGACKSIVQYPIHIKVHDMQIAEDAQLIIGHICMQWLCANQLKSL